MEYEDLINAAYNFYKAAAEPPTTQQYVKNFQYAIGLEVAKGSRVVNFLLHKTPKSTALSSMNKIFIDIASLNKKLLTDDPVYITDQILGQVNNAKFFIEKSNTGIGYDKSISEGPASPAGYINRIELHAKNLLKFISPNQQQKQEMPNA